MSLPKLEKLFTGIVVVVAAARDDELLALHPDPSVARVGALDVLDNVRAARRDADVATDVAFPLVADRGAIFAYVRSSQVWKTQRSENERSCSPPEYMPQCETRRLRMNEKLVESNQIAVTVEVFVVVLVALLVVLVVHMK